MKATEVLARMAWAYSECSSYQDSGRVAYSTDDDSPTEFKTYFARPRRFRFEWVDVDPDGSKEEPNIIWCSGAQATSLYQYDAPEIETCDLNLAIAGATGVSKGSALTAAALLLPEIRDDCRHILLLKDLQLHDEQIVVGVNCYVLQGSFERDNDTTLWISTADFSLRQLKEDSYITAEESKAMHEEFCSRQKEKGVANCVAKQTEFADYQYSETCTYEQVLFDEAIERSVFEYRPTEITP